MELVNVINIIAVHPRVGGEHFVGFLHIFLGNGSSPRGRGTLNKRSTLMGKKRFIPAWAGNTISSAVFQNFESVHPRVGGEHARAQSSVHPDRGSSPRGRGTRKMTLFSTGRSRFIPAWAGNTVLGIVNAIPISVHPRVGGEHPWVSTLRALPTGSSPRGRGTQFRNAFLDGGRRFIPAWAGNTASESSEFSSDSVHPRVGGEHTTGVGAARRCAGSSPRGRGTRQRVTDKEQNLRFIPAWAGNTKMQRLKMQNRTVHPRVGGEHVRKHLQRFEPFGSSPRGRGTHNGETLLDTFVRFIPAWAGNTRKS